MFLMIQNSGVSCIEGFTLLGMSTTRDCGTEGTIGCFGSGTKHAINVLLRAGLKLVVYCGKTRLEFLTRADTVNDGLTSKEVRRVYVQFGGTSQKKLDLGWVVDFGVLDWTELGMALREFISNAIDRTLREEDGKFENAILDGRLAVHEVADTHVRGKDGYTRVYVEANDEVRRYVAELPRRFLHFSFSPGDVRKRLLPKAGRNLSELGTAMIYREGVFVRELREQRTESLYDYNFRSSEVQIDESRNSSEYAVRAACAKVMRSAGTEELVPIFRSLTRMEDTFEAGLDPYYLGGPSWEPQMPEHQGNWQRAWEAVAGESVMCEPTAQHATLVQRKGKTPQTVKSFGWVQAAERFGIVTSSKVLTASESKGREPCPVTPAARKAVETVWGWIASLGMTNEKDIPPVACYRDITNAEEDRMGYYLDGIVHLREDIASGGNKYLLKTALEEVVHHVTGAGDNSRDIQSFLIDLVIEVAG